MSGSEDRSSQGEFFDDNNSNEGGTITDPLLNAFLDDDVKQVRQVGRRGEGALPMGRESDSKSDWSGNSDSDNDMKRK